MSDGSKNATTILVFGLLGFALPCLGLPFGIAAWIMGNTALRELNAGFGDPSLRWKVEAGRILGIIGIIETILWGTCFAFSAAYYVVTYIIMESAEAQKQF